MSRTRYAPDTLTRPADWRGNAACRTEDPELHFPRGYDGATNLAQITAATHATNEQYIDSVCALFADVIGITRLALDQQKTT